jgi:predicted MFS family arabinose efflux permease
MKLIHLLALCAFLVGLDALLVIPLAPQMAGVFGHESELAGWLIAAYALPYAFGALLLGPLSDRRGRVQVLLSGLLLFSLATFLTALARQLDTLLLLRAVAGLGAAAITPNLFALLADAVTEEHRGRATGVVYGSMISATVFGVPLGAWLAAHWGWSLSFVFVGGLGCLLLPIMVKYGPKARVNPDGTEGEKSHFSRLRRVASDRRVGRALLTTFLWYAALYAVFANIGYFYTARFALRIDDIGSIILLAGAASVAGNILGGRRADARGGRHILLAAASMAAPVLLAFVLPQQSLFLAIAGHAIWAFLVGFGSAPLMALVSEMRSGDRATVLALNSFAMYLGMTLASSMGGSLIATWGFIAAAAASTMLYLGVILVGRGLPGIGVATENG